MKRCPACQGACQDTNRHCPSCGADVGAVASEQGDPYLGTTLVGKYKLEELIGVGAMGRVYRAVHLGLDAPVAVKLLADDIATDPVSVKRFQNEARATSRLHHPNAIAIVDFGQAASGTLYLVMELLRGRTVSQIVRDDGPMAAPRLAEIVGQALAALDEAHAQGIIHRDFKPENIFVETLRSGREHAKVLDFGIAKLRGETETGLTSAGLVCGTPDYMSPEQIRGLELDARTDVYAAGVVLYEALTGRRLFEGLTALIDVLQAHLHRRPEPPRLRRPDLPISAEMEAVVMKALAKDAKDRYSTALELREAVERAAGPVEGRCTVCGAPRLGGRFCAECGAALPSLTPMRGVPIVTAAPTADVPTRHDISVALARSLTPQPLSTVPATLPFCGRDDLLESLAALPHGAALIVGEPGAGKSTLARAWLERRGARGRHTLLVEAEGAGLVAPLAPVRRLVAAVLGLSERPDEEVIERALGAHEPDRAGIAILFGAAGRATRLPLDARRRECRAAVLSVLQRATLDVVLDDLHLFDTVSREIVTELLAAPGDLVIVATSTRVDVTSSTVERIVLEPLSGTVLAGLLVPSDVVARSGGLPFAVETELRAFAEGARARTTAARVDALAPGPRLVAQVLAVAGGPVQPSLLEAALGVAPAELERTLAPLRERSLLRPGAPLRLSSPTLRREIYEGIDIDRRRSLHAHVGGLLERARGEVHAVAYHALLCGESEPQRLPELTTPLLSPLEGIAALERAGVAARESFDDEGASRTLRAAMERCRLTLLSGGNEEAEPLLMHVALKLGVVLRYQQDLPAAEVVLREAAQLAQSRTDRWALAEARRALARVHALSGRPERAHDDVHQALKAALALGDAQLLCECYLELGDLVARQGAPVDAAQELEEGVLLVTQGDGPAVEDGPAGLPRLLVRLAELRLELGQRQAAEKLVGHALRLGEATPDEAARARLFAQAAHVMHGAGRHEDAARLRRQAVDELRALGDRRSTAEQLLALADEDASLDADRRAWLLEAQRLSTDVGWSHGSAATKQRLGHLV